MIGPLRLVFGPLHVTPLHPLLIRCGHTVLMAEYEEHTSPSGNQSDDVQEITMAQYDIPFRGGELLFAQSNPQAPWWPAWVVPADQVSPKAPRGGGGGGGSKGEGNIYRY